MNVMEEPLTTVLVNATELIVYVYIDNVFFILL